MGRIRQVNLEVRDRGAARDVREESGRCDPDPRRW